MGTHVHCPKCKTSKACLLLHKELGTGIYNPERNTPWKGFPLTWGPYLALKVFARIHQQECNNSTVIRLWLFVVEWAKFDKDDVTEHFIKTRNRPKKKIHYHCWLSWPHFKDIKAMKAIRVRNLSSLINEPNI